MPVPFPEAPSTDNSLLINKNEQITSEWLSKVLKTPVSLESVGPVGTGQMSKTLRVKFKLEDGSEEQDSVIVKLTSDSEASQAMGFSGAYESETVFYASYGAQIAKTTAAPYCWLAVFVKGADFTLVLEDMKNSTQGDQLNGCTPEQAAISLSALAKIQAPFLGNWDYPKSGIWIFNEGSLTAWQDGLYRDTLPTFLKQYEGIISPEHAELCLWIEPRVKAWLDEPKDTVWGYRHRDFRLDNILFPKEGDRVVAVDFQGSSWGMCMEDASYFMGSSLVPEDRRRCEKEVIRNYVTELNGGDDTKLDWETAWYQYRRGAIFGILQAVYASVLCVRTPRGDQMFCTLLARHAEHCLDMKIKELFP